jgi:hypothetical protein
MPIVPATQKTKARGSLQTREASLGNIVRPPTISGKQNKFGHWWLTLVILTTQEAEIRRIMV